MANKTAVQWLFEKLPTIDKHDPYYEKIFQEALQMEKQQIINAVDGFPLENRNLDGIDYYNSTYPELPIEPTQQKPNNHFFIGGCI
jgi:hypothetical protein